MQAIGRSRGGRTTKIHALTAARGRPVALTLTPGNAHDLDGAFDLLELVPTPRRLIADRAYDARRLREWLQQRGAEAVIPPNPTRKHPHAYNAEVYKSRNLIAGSRTFAEWQRATTSSPETSSLAPSSQQP